MGIDLWFETSFVSHRPPILKVKVLNFKFIMVNCNAAVKSSPKVMGKNFLDQWSHLLICLCTDATSKLGLASEYIKHSGA